MRPKKRVKLIDANPDSWSFIKTVLEVQGFEVTDHEPDVQVARAWGDRHRPEHPAFGLHGIAGPVSYVPESNGNGEARAEEVIQRAVRESCFRMIRIPLKHGTNSGYHRGCKCLHCRVAHSKYSILERIRRVGR